MSASSSISNLPVAGAGTSFAGVAVGQASGAISIIWAFLLVSIILAYVAIAIIMKQRVTSRWLHNGRE